MRIQREGGCVKIWASANNTYDWAHRANNSWPCSTLSGKRFFAEFWKGYLEDLTVDGKYGQDIDGTEFNAFIEDHLGIVNPE